VTTQAARVCAGPCNRQYRRAEANTANTGEKHDLKPDHGDPNWCSHCADTVEHCLAELPELLVTIHLEAIHGTPTPGARVHHARLSPAWPGESARMLTDLIAGGLMEMEDDLRDLRGYSPRPVLPEGQGASQAIAVIGGSLDWLLQQHPNADDPDWSPGAILLRWHHTAVRFTKADTPRIQQKHLPCPRCDLLTLVKTPGDDSIECGNCGNRLREDEYQRRVQQYAVFERAKQAA
jgi:hypothetical protein